ncbi:MULTISPECIES: Crp/Fnr family transcriptional regulator [unclassified Brevundimonas]|uniref:Crp/Fnr family transcriptional regulator n=1 Tax=unclassified Brevundimonas TaxID=2622653 RepID=UPI0025BF8489|nr:MULTISPECIES: Crp/Fnr family transcriptional regulator [unclassified Brevundimonas]
MQTRINLINASAGASRVALDICDHPVFQALPPDVQSTAQTHSLLETLPTGRILPESGSLSFILSGVLGLFPNSDGVCVATVVAGSVHGWDQAFAPDNHPPGVRALIDTTLCRVPASQVVGGLGREWLTRLVARQSSGRFNEIAAEAACNASHLVQERLAKWLVRLHCGGNGAPLHLTQGDFGAMLGVQRTSINAAAGRLQALGLVRFGRGRVQILDLAGLRSASCCLDGVKGEIPKPRLSSSPGAERRSAWPARPLQDTAA